MKYFSYSYNEARNMPTKKNVSNQTLSGRHINWNSPYEIRVYTNLKDNYSYPLPFLLSLFSNLNHIIHN